MFFIFPNLRIVKKKQLFEFISKLLNYSMVIDIIFALIQTYANRICKKHSIYQAG